MQGSRGKYRDCPQMSSKTSDLVVVCGEKTDKVLASYELLSKETT